MIPYIAIAAGVTIGASILRCIFDELSSEEIERQEEIQKKRSEADASYKKYKSGLEASKRSHLDQISQDEAARTEAMQRENYFYSYFYIFLNLFYTNNIVPILQLLLVRLLFHNIIYS